MTKYTILTFYEDHARIMWMGDTMDTTSVDKGRGGWCYDLPGYQCNSVLQRLTRDSGHSSQHRIWDPLTSALLYASSRAPQDATYERTITVEGRTPAVGAAPSTRVLRPRIPKAAPAPLLSDRLFLPSEPYYSRHELLCLDGVDGLSVLQFAPTPRRQYDLIIVWWDRTNGVPA